ncbi:hypothetical protein DDB_G0273571 [Dictyostelium discoideum AX4]|uniref:Transmembrane protein n=1 Tax=Dictyostelium discoideum TaxID=44689 RepID=Q557G7_DICDI|nr:hypothetical protein DDB_G0273469 [Dictyostelium discoideum AX4]XP_644668.1 hypothetical protein DDB_G0273571 [Dictyostelium discoideum AX4]EAL70689.1 hypothetical protein DDB_G0273469 [Dictyostelium discoideum AX4]EAL70740.1 hypothetical protein DDB_G0273571 [Dictyostelium discoideum AX4]|eukprot:XP_644583.1 hypothetical protein DDB_G0273469 [Dictyostelium discoideum AX4]
MKNQKLGYFIFFYFFLLFFVFILFFLFIYFFLFWVVSANVGDVVSVPYNHPKKKKKT